MRKIRILSSLFLLALNSCSNEEIYNEEANTNYEKRITVVADDLTPANGTRTTYTEGENRYHFAWADGDELGIFPTEGRQTAFPISQESAGSNTALFNGGKWSLRPNESYAAYYPLNESLSIDKTAIPVSYLGQTQDGNGDTRHLAAYDYMASAFTQVDAKGNVNLKMKHLSCLVQFNLTMPKAGTFNKVEITSDNVEFIIKGTFDLSSDDTSIIASETSTSFTIKLENISTDSNNQQISVNTLIAPVDLSESTLRIEVFSENRTDVFFFRGIDMTCGNAYVPVEDTTIEYIPYITFEAEELQTLKMSRTVSTLEYSINDGDWTELKTTTVTFGGDKGRLRLRAKSSTGTTTSNVDSGSSIISFSTPAKVKCYGDIRTLIDYESYNSVNTNSAKFCHLFKDCITLTSAPELPAAALTDYCYYSMFQGCTSLLYAPALPAASLKKYCYAYMFKGCTSLFSVPELSATTLATGCCTSMFEKCTSLSKAPNKLQALELADFCYNKMFDGCISLESGPKLPSLNLASCCYLEMFSGCTSLIQAPELPAITLAEGCYSGMFSNCSNLNYIKMMAKKTATDCMYHWTEGVASTGTFIKNRDAKWTTTGVSGVPTGWVVVLEEGVDNKESVDLGLPSGTKWATMNVGASSPTDFGDYYAWGETTTKSSFGVSNYKYCKNPNAIEKIWTKYSIRYISDDKRTTLETSDDIAYQEYGDDWRMPTYSDMLELVSNCTFEHSTINDTNIIIATGPNGNSIVLPILGSNGEQSDIVVGGYWSSSLYSDHKASNHVYALILEENSSPHISYNYRVHGAGVRPVIHQ